MINYLPVHPLTLTDIKNTTQTFTANNIGWDQQFSNLAWLCFPDIETSGFKILPDAFLDSTILSMRKGGELREALKLRPLQFVNYWKEQEQSERFTLEEGLPEGYMNTLTKQAKKAHVRLLGLVRKENVLFASFKQASFTPESFRLEGFPCNIITKEAV